MTNPKQDSPSTWGLYVHFPWCVAKCPYCDFNSHPLRGDLDAPTYIAALLADFQRQVENEPVTPFSSLFLGGGTPSLLPPDAFAQLLEGLAPWIDNNTEITMEANPGSREHWDFRGYRQAGINRLSIGAQSFSASQLQRLGRIHAADDTKRAYQLARDGGFENINLDLMYALPEQTTEQAVDDLNQALALKPDHLSWYQLTIEPKTEFAQRPPVLPQEDSVSHMEQHGHALLANAGFARYEISAYAKPGKRCRHNLNYWHFGDYLGIGAGAQGKRTRSAGVTRTQKYSQPRRYLEHFTNTESKGVATQELAGEFAMNVLRLVDGMDKAQMAAAIGQVQLPKAIVTQVQDQLDSAWQPLVQRGLMHADRFATTSFGLQHLDTVVAEFL